MNIHLMATSIPAIGTDRTRTEQNDTESQSTGAFMQMNTMNDSHSSLDSRKEYNSHNNMNDVDQSSSSSAIIEAGQEHDCASYPNKTVEGTLAPRNEELANKLAVQLQTQLKNRTFQSNDSLSDDDNMYNSKKRKLRSNDVLDNLSIKKVKSSPEFILPELTEDALKIYHEKRRKNFPSRQKLQMETQERWKRIERGEIIWEDYSSGQWQLNRESEQTMSMKYSTKSQNQMEDHSLIFNVLKADRDREANVALQIIRYFIHHRFFFEDHELEVDIVNQLNDLERRTKTEMLGSIESLKKKFPREEDIEEMSNTSSGTNSENDSDNESENEFGEIEDETSLSISEEAIKSLMEKSDTPSHSVSLKHDMKQQQKKFSGSTHQRGGNRGQFRGSHHGFNRSSNRGNTHHRSAFNRNAHRSNHSKS